VRQRHRHTNRLANDAHATAQRNCHHLIHCAVDGPTRKTVVDHLDYARRVGDSNDILVRLAQLTGPCCLPPAEPANEGGLGTTERREPVDVTLTVKPLDGNNQTLSATPDTIYLTPTRGAEWLQRAIAQTRPDRVIVAVVPADPHTPNNRMTVRPDGSAAFAT